MMLYFVFEIALAVLIVLVAQATAYLTLKPWIDKKIVEWLYESGALTEILLEWYDAGQRDERSVQEISDVNWGDKP